MDKHCDSCGRSIIEPIDFEEAVRRALKFKTGHKDDAEMVGVSANEYGLWSVRFLTFTGVKAYIHERVLNIEQE